MHRRICMRAHEQTCTHTHKQGQTYVLRVYNNGNKTGHVEYEHELLKALHAQAPNLSFELPKFFPVKGGTKTFAEVSNGAQACLCSVIPGVLPKTTNPQILGRAVGELMSALESVKIDLKAPTPPYFNVWDVHTHINPEAYKEVTEKADMDFIREHINTLTKLFEECMVRVETYKGTLPMQRIHGDLHYDNCLVAETQDRVTGVLDFEFTAYDWRAMEVAVCLSKYAAEDSPLELMQSFISGYAEHGKLNRAEAEAMPDLINLRVFSNVFFFIGRSLAGEDSIVSFTKRAKMYADRVVWVNANRKAITEAICTQMGAKLE
jgi:homoserine kinase type II